ncbi:snRNA-activating protein complex subunit 4 [Garra rufa]|uniref:snRNA-activating protein complex subunit 4 n=1 Tax=Garra rufa TaxID=137080 RepID=UPI003CCEC22F
MESNELLAKRDKIQREILALESTLGADSSSIIDLLSSDSSSGDDESDDGGPEFEGVERDDLEAERLRIQREIDELENTLGANAALVDVLDETEQDTDSSDENSDDEELELPQNVETCLQMNMVYQEVLKEKLAELERLLSENQQQQKEIEVQLSGPSTSSSTVPGVPPQKQFLGYFMKPYFKDKLTGLGPPANEETKARQSYGTRPFEQLKIKRWDGWQKTLLTNAVAKDTMKRMVQPKLSKLDYLSAKMSKADDERKEELKKQIDLIEKEITEISALKDDQLLGNRHDDHDWEKISNIDFEGLRQAEDLKRFWQNYLHPTINKSVWKQDEIDKLKGIVEEYNCCHWDKIAEALGTNRTAFMCFQTYQRYISKTFRRKEWTKEEDEILRKLVEKMRVGNFIPYIQMSYFMEGRDGSQLSYRWTSVLDPSIKKGPWSKEEDQLLRNAVAKYGPKEWGKIRLEVPGRTDGACRDRYLDCLQENVKKGPWSIEEVELLKEKVAKYGVGKWAKIASEIPNRVDCQCLNKWKLLTQASKREQTGSQGIKRRRKPATVPRKRQKVLKKTIKEEMMTSSSEDEKKIKYIDSDAESDLPLVKDEERPQILEIPRKDYVQPDIKKWIPVNANTLLQSPGTVRTVWVHPPTSEDELETSTTQSGLGRIPSENSKCLNVRLGLVRNTILNRLGNLEKTYVGLKPDALQSQSDDEKAMLKVSFSDIKHFLQWKGPPVIKKNDLKEKMTSPKNIKRRRPVQDMASFNNDLLKAITPWIGNVILPAPANENTFCEGDIVGMKAADITLLKTSVFSFFLKAFQIDIKGCKNVIEIQQKISIKMPIAQSKPKTVSMILKESKQKAKHKKPAEPPQHPPPLQPVLLNPLQLPVRQMTIPALIQPKPLVITQPNKQRAVQPVLPKEQRISLLPQSPSQIPLPLIQQTAPAQTLMASTPKSSSVENSNSVRCTKRTRKPTEKIQALMEEAEDKASKKELLKRNQGKQNVIFPTITLQNQPVNWIFAPTNLVQVTGPPSPNVPSNQTLIVANSSPQNNSIRPCISTNLYPSSSTLLVAASYVNPALIGSSVSNASRDAPKTSSSVKMSPKIIQMPLSPTSTLVQNKSVQHGVQMLSPTPIKVNQKGSHNEAIKNSSDSSSDECIIRHYQTFASAGSKVSSTVYSVLPDPLTVAPSARAPVVSKPTNEVAVAMSPAVTENGCVSMRTIQQPTIIQQKSLPFTILSPPSVSRISHQPIASSPFIAPSPQILALPPQNVAPSTQIVAPSSQIVVSSSQMVAPPPPQIVAPPPRILASSPQIVAPPPRIFAPSFQIVAPSPRIVSPSSQIVVSSSHIVAPSSQIVVSSSQIVATPPQIVPPPPRIMAPPPQTLAPSPQIVSPPHQILASSPQIVAPSTQIVAPSSQIVVSSSQMVAPPPRILVSSPQIVSPPPRIFTPSFQIVAPSPRIVAPSSQIVVSSSPIVATPPQIVPPPPRIVAPPPQIVAQSPQIISPPPRIVSPSTHIVASSSHIVASSPQIVSPSTQIVSPSPQIVSPSPQIVAPSPQIVAPPPRIVAPPPQSLAQSPQIVAPPPRIVSPSPQVVVNPSDVPQMRTSGETSFPLPDIPSDVLSFNPHLIFPQQSSEVDDWMNGKGGIPLPHLEMSLPYLPPSATSIKTLTSLLKVKQSLLTVAVNVLPVEYRNYREEEAQVAAIRKMIAERFASNPAYQLFKARFLSCFTLPALLATINPSEECSLPTDKCGDEDELLHLQKRKERIRTPAARIELNTNENEASAKQFSGIGTKRQRSRRRVT